MSTSSTDPRTSLFLLWTSLPPLIDGSIPHIKAINTPPHSNISHEQLLQVYLSFTSSCSDNTKDFFEETLGKGKDKCYPWEVESFEAGYAWFEAFAIAALEIQNFFGEENDVKLEERVPKIKGLVKVVVKGQNRYVDDAFGAAAALTIRCYLRAGELR